MGAQRLQRFFRLVLVFLELLKCSHHVCRGYRLRLSRVLHPSLDELLSGVHLAMNHDCKEVADQQTFAEGDPEQFDTCSTEKHCLIRLMDVLCQVRGVKAFSAFLDFLPIDASFPQ